MRSVVHGLVDAAISVAVGVFADILIEVQSNRCAYFKHTCPRHNDPIYHGRGVKTRIQGGNWSVVWSLLRAVTTLSYSGVALTLCYPFIVSLPYLYDWTVCFRLPDLSWTLPHLEAVCNIPETVYCDRDLDA